MLVYTSPSCFTRQAPDVGNRSGTLRPYLADLFLAAATAALRRLGQPGGAALAVGAWRPRPLPPLGLARGRAAPRLACPGARSARAWRQPMVARRQLLDGRLCLPPPPADPSAGIGARDHRVAFARRQHRDPLRRGLSRYGAPARCDRRARALAGADRGASIAPDRRAHAEMARRTARAGRATTAPLCLDRGRAEADAGSQRAPLARAGAPSDPARGQSERGRHLQLEIRQLRAHRLALWDDPQRDRGIVGPDQLPDPPRLRQGELGLVLQPRGGRPAGGFSCR